jgi:hypothetical protein
MEMRPSAAVAVQVRAVVKKNFLLLKRNRKTFFRDSCVPLFHLGVLILLATFFKNLDAPEKLDQVEYTLEAAFPFHGSRIVGFTTSTPRSACAPFVNRVIRSAEMAGAASGGPGLRCYNSVAALNLDARRRGTMAAAVIFDDVNQIDSPSNQTLKFTIKLNHTAVGNLARVNFSNPAQGPSSAGEVYISSGFVAVQHIVQEAVLASYGNSSGLSFESVNIRKFPTAAYVQNTRVAVLSVLGPLYMVFVFSQQVCSSPSSTILLHRRN